MPLMEKTTALPTSVQGVPLKPHLVIVTSDRAYPNVFPNLP